jgi:hypothetical protein
MEEIRKDIKWWEWIYQVSNIWRIRSYDRKVYTYTKKWRILKSQIDKYWYYVGSFYKWKERTTYKVHRIVAETFIPNISNKITVNHKNWIRHDNRVENLEWMTYSENHKHAFSVLKRNHRSTWKFWNNSFTKKWVIQMDINWNEIKKRECMRVAAQELWILESCISSCCSWRKYYKSAWWFKRSFL